MGKFLTVLILTYTFCILLSVFLKPFQKYRRRKRYIRQAERKARKEAAEESRWQQSYGYRGCQKKGPNPYDYHHSNRLDSPDVKDNRRESTRYPNSGKKAQPGGSQKSKPHISGRRTSDPDAFKRPPELRRKPLRQEYDDEPEEGLVEFDKGRYMEEVRRSGIDLSLTPDDADIIKDPEEENYVNEENALEREREAEEEKIEAILAQEAI